MANAPNTQHNTFDFIDAASHGYNFLWAHRKTLLTFALPLFIIKAITYITILGFGLETQFLRQGLLMAPSAFIEGWFLALLIRLQIFGEALPKSLIASLSLDKKSNLFKHLMSASLVYVLIKLFIALIAGMLSYSIALDPAPPTPQDAPPTIGPAYFTAVGLLLGTIWAFRLIWLYVPLALGQTMRSYLHAIRSYFYSFKLLATWMVCFIPPLVAMVIIQQVLGTLLGAETIKAASDDQNVLVSSIMVLFQAGIEIIISIVSSAAITYGIARILLNIPDGKSQS